MDSFRSFAVVNPVSGGKRCGGMWKDILYYIKKYVNDISYKFTSCPKDATFLTRSAIKDGYEMIISVGGDGTLNEVVQGFFENDKLINPSAVLGIVCTGTGADFIRACNIPKDYKLSTKILQGRKTKKIDIGCVNFINYKNENERRYFINIADFGVGGEIVDRVNKTTKFFGGFISFLYSTVVVSLKYKNKEVNIKIDDKEIKRKIKNVFCANGVACGGGMRVAPGADLSDGVFEIVVLGDLSFFEGVRIMRSIYRGKKISNHKVEYYRGKTLYADSKEKVLLDIDGEQPGTLPVKMEIIPSCINLKI